MPASPFESIPKAKRKVLTSHDALGYFGDAYGVTLMAPVGFSTESEVSAEQLAKLINQIKAEGVKAYFIENSTDPRLVQQIARATGARPAGELYVEALSGQNGPAPTYVAMFRHNVDCSRPCVAIESAMPDQSDQAALGAKSSAARRQGHAQVR